MYLTGQKQQKNLIRAGFLRDFLSCTKTEVFSTILSETTENKTVRGENTVTCKAGCCVFSKVQAPGDKEQLQQDTRPIFLRAPHSKNV